MILMARDKIAVGYGSKVSAMSKSDLLAWANRT